MNYNNTLLLFLLSCGVLSYATQNESGTNLSLLSQSLERLNQIVPATSKVAPIYIPSGLAPDQSKGTIAQNIRNFQNLGGEIPYPELEDLQKLEQQYDSLAAGVVDLHDTKLATAQKSAFTWLAKEYLTYYLSQLEKLSDQALSNQLSSTDASSLLKGYQQTIDALHQKAPHQVDIRQLDEFKNFMKARQQLQTIYTQATQKPTVEQLQKAVSTSKVKDTIRTAQIVVPLLKQMKDIGIAANTNNVKIKGLMALGDQLKDVQMTFKMIENSTGVQKKAFTREESAAQSAIDQAIRRLLDALNNKESLDVFVKALRPSYRASLQKEIAAASEKFNAPAIPLQDCYGDSNFETLRKLALSVDSLSKQWIEAAKKKNSSDLQVMIDEIKKDTLAPVLQDVEKFKNCADIEVLRQEINKAQQVIKQLETLLKTQQDYETASAAGMSS